MIDLNPHVPPDVQKKIGSLTMSDRAAEEIGLILTGHEHPEIAEPAGFCPIVAGSVSQFLASPYFERSAWFRRQPVHRTVTISINPGGVPSETSITPLFHLQKNQHGYTVVSCDEVPLPESYDTERVIEETKIEMGVPA